MGGQQLPPHNTYTTTTILSWGVAACAGYHLVILSHCGTHTQTTLTFNTEGPLKSEITSFRAQNFIKHHKLLVHIT